MSLSRFLFQVDMTGNADAGLGKIEERLGRISAGTRAIGGDLGGAMGQFHIASRADAVSSMFTSANNYIQNTKAALLETAQGLMTEASAFEDIEAGLKFSFGEDKWQNVFTDVKKDAADLTFTLAEVSDLASSLGRMKINPFGGDKKEDQLFLSRTGEKVRALEVLQDTADAAGKKTGDLTIALRNALGGQWTSLQTRFDLDKKLITKMKDGVKKAKSQQEAYNMIVSDLALMFGGAGRLKADNWNKIAAQVPDLVQQLRGRIGADALKQMTPALKGFVEALTSFVKNEAAMKGLADAAKTVGQVFAWLINVGSTAITTMSTWLGKFPMAGKLALAFVAIKLAIAGAIVAAATFAGSVAAIGAAISIVSWPALIAGAASFVAFLPGVLAMGAAFVGFAAAAKFGADILTHNWGEGSSILSGFEKIKLVMDGLGQLMDSFDGRSGKMSAATATALQKNGLLGFVKEVFKHYSNARRAIAYFFDTIDQGKQALAPTFIPFMYELGRLAVELAEVFGLIPAKTDKNVSSLDAMKGIAKSAAGAIIELARATVLVARVGVGIIHYVKNWEYLDSAILVAKGALFAFGVVAVGVGVAASAALLIPIAGLTIMVGLVSALVIGIHEMSEAWSFWKATTFGTEEERAAAVAKRNAKNEKAAKEAKATEGMSMMESVKYHLGLGKDFQAPDMSGGPLAPRREMIGTKYRDKDGNYIPTSVGNAMEGFRPPTAEEAAKQANSDEVAPGSDTTFAAWLAKTGAASPSNPQPGVAETLRGLKEATPEGSAAADQQRAATEAAAAQKAATEQQTAATRELAAAIKSQPIVLELDGKQLAAALRGATERSAGGGAWLWRKSNALESRTTTPGPTSSCP